MHALILIVTFALTLLSAAQRPLVGAPLNAAQASPTPSTGSLQTLDLFRDSNLAAWCIVPFDKAKRFPEQRAEML